jgi:hypothetical protein
MARVPSEYWLRLSEIGLVYHAALKQMELHQEPNLAADDHGNSAETIYEPDGYSPNRRDVIAENLCKYVLHPYNLG